MNKIKRFSDLEAGKIYKITFMRQQNTWDRVKILKIGNSENVLGKSYALIKNLETGFETAMFSTHYNRAWFCEIKE